MLDRSAKNVGYIRYNSRKYETCKEKILNFIRKILGKVVKENIDNGVIILAPRYSSKYMEHQIIKQINRYVKDNNIKYIVYENELEEIALKLENVSVLNGKYIMKNNVLGILEYIYKIRNENINLENIYIFVNEYTKRNISIIEMLCEKFKTVNIITENIRYYKRLEDAMYNQGILITVSNNKRKSVRNAKIVINMDFAKENFEKYNINMNSIIINLTNEKNFFENTFRGVMINNFEIEIDKNLESFYLEFYGKVNTKLLLESFVISKGNYNDYFSEISQLIGIRGTIQKSEFCRNY